MMHFKFTNIQFNLATSIHYFHSLLRNYAEQQQLLILVLTMETTEEVMITCEVSSKEIIPRRFGIDERIGQSKEKKRFRFPFLTTLEPIFAHKQTPQMIVLIQDEHTILEMC